MAKLKAIVFDIDDTLIDWTNFNGDWAEFEAPRLSSVIDYINTHHPIDDHEEFATQFRERSMQAWVAARLDYRAPHMGRVLVDAAVAQGVPPGVLDPRRCLEAYEWTCIPGTRLFPDVIEGLTLLRETGVKLGIVTNAYQPMWMREVELIDHGMDVDKFFPTCRFSAADFGYLKPHPSIFQAALECLNVQASEMVYVGDNLLADIVGAKRVGSFAVLRNSRPDQDEPDEAVPPDATIETLHDLAAVLDDAFPGWRN